MEEEVEGVGEVAEEVVGVAEEELLLVQLGLWVLVHLVQSLMDPGKREAELYPWLHHHPSVCLFVFFSLDVLGI